MGELRFTIALQGVLISLGSKTQWIEDPDGREGTWDSFKRKSLFAETVASGRRNDRLVDNPRESKSYWISPKGREQNTNLTEATGNKQAREMATVENFMVYRLQVLGCWIGVERPTAKNCVESKDPSASLLDVVVRKDTEIDRVDRG